VTHDDERDDALLSRLARTGDARAFDTLYRRHTPGLYATAVRITHDADAAADIVHDTWVRAVESLGRFEQRSATRTWLTGILLNRHREWLRERRRDGAAEDSNVDDLIDPTYSSPVDATRFDRLDLEAAIAALAPGFRSVLVLHDIEGFTHDEIGAMLGLAPGTSKSQLARARQRVRLMLETGIPKAAHDVRP
jgi:RNA polymerase sigma-70 factor (ECF subfamily)